jgi:tripartite-type tricarboxylate transporter receptor subunit TctC
MAPGVTADQIAYFNEVFKKMMATPEWKEYMEKGAFSQTVLTGKEFADWLTKAEANHKQLMQEAGFLAK